MHGRGFDFAWVQVETGALEVVYPLDRFRVRSGQKVAGRFSSERSRNTPWKTARSTPLCAVTRMATTRPTQLSSSDMNREQVISWRTAPLTFGWEESTKRA